MTVFPRLGQGSFRLIVTDSYDRRCAFTNSPVLHVLEAAHIRPYSSGGTHAPSNGILLRQDLHTLFDRGYMTVTPSHRIEVSSRIREEFHNGKEYYALHGEIMRLPEYGDRRPSAEFLNGTTTTCIAASYRERTCKDGLLSHYGVRQERSGNRKGLIPRSQPLAQNQFGSKLVARILVAFW